MNKFKKITIMILIIAGIISGLGFGLQNSQKAKGAVSQQGLVLWLKMDDNLGTTNVIDYSVEGNHGTLSDVNGSPGATTAAHSEVSLHQRALTFDGTDDYVNCGSDPSLDITDAITIEAWVKIANHQTQFIVAHSNADWAYEFEAYSNGNITFNIQQDSDGDVMKTSQQSVNTDEWYHIIGTYDKDLADAATRLKLYVNGEHKVSGAAAGTIRVPVITTIGTRGVYYFNGSIDGVKIYNRALSADEIAHSYFMGSATRIKNATIKNARIGDSGLVGWWRMNDNAANTTVVDLSGYSNTGTAQQNTEDLTTAGQIDEALTFNGSTDYINCGNDSSFNITDAITVSAWVKLDTENVYSTILGSSSAYGDWVWFLVRAEGTGSRVTVNLENIVLYGNVETSTDLLLGVWYHVVFSYDKDSGSNNLNIYVDGSIAATGTYTGSIGGLSGNVRVGRTSDYSFPGSIDEVRIWNRALSAQEILDHYNLEK